LPYRTSASEDQAQASLDMTSFEIHLLRVRFGALSITGAHALLARRHTGVVFFVGFVPLAARPAP
jgi:hypothetical protein